jgi:peptidoglycan/LPS O-acetylase OafA/YrhL
MTGEPTRAAAPRFAELDGLRALSVLAVFVFHAVPPSAALITRGWDPQLDLGAFTAGLPAGVADYVLHLNLGVQVFFVLSGFLITRMFAGPYLAHAPGPSVAVYTLRRAVRIFPAYWMVLLIAGASWFGIEAFGFPTPFGAWKHASLTYLYFREHGAVPDYGGLAVSWSLVAEITFYAFVPLWMVALAASRPRDRRRAALAAAAVCIPAGVASILVFAYGDQWAARTPLSGLVTAFGAALAALGFGMVLAVLDAARTRDAALDARLTALGTRSARWWVAAGLLYVVLAWPDFGYLAATDGQVVWQRLVQPLIAVLLVAPAVLAPGAATHVHAFLRTRPLVFVGTVSYGVYLWHTVVIGRVHSRWPLDERAAPGALLVLLAMLAVTLVVSAASWYLLERPLLALAHRVGRRPAASRGPTLAAS